MYKPKEKQQIRTREKLLYLSFEALLLDQLKEHGSVSRKEVKELTGMGRCDAGSILKEFVERGVVEKREFCRYSVF